MIDRPDRNLRSSSGNRAAFLLSIWLLGVLAVLGPAVFAARAAGRSPERAWLILFVNLVTWSGVAHGGVAISALLYLFGARWSPGLRRIAESTSACLPVSVLLHIIMVARPRLQAPPDSGVLYASIALDLLCMSYVFVSLRPDLGSCGDQDHLPGGRVRAFMTFRWRGLAGERERRTRLFAWLAPLVIAWYFIVQTLIAIDVTTHLSPGWRVPQAGVHLLTSGFCFTAAFTGAAAILMSDHPKYKVMLRRDQVAGLSTMVLGTCALWSYVGLGWLMGIIPGGRSLEFDFASGQVGEQPWSTLMGIVVLVSVVIPVLTLLPDRLRERSSILLPLLLLVAAGSWLERSLLVIQSFWSGAAIAIGPAELVISGGFAASFVLLTARFIEFLPPPEPALSRSRRPRGSPGIQESI